MGREDQVEEREVLDSIFPEEITGELCARDGEESLVFVSEFPLTLVFNVQTSPKIRTEYRYLSTHPSLMKKSLSNPSYAWKSHTPKNTPMSPRSSASPRRPMQPSILG